MRFIELHAAPRGNAIWLDIDQVSSMERWPTLTRLYLKDPGYDPVFTVLETPTEINAIIAGVCRVIGETKVEATE